MGGVYIKNKWLPYLLILPTIILICIFKIYPIIDSVIQGVLSTEGSFTLENYKLLFADKTFWNSLWVTLSLESYYYTAADYHCFYYGHDCQCQSSWH